MENMETKEKIASKFHDMICQKSYSQITIDDLAKAVPVSRRTFYNYFKDKEDILFYIVYSDFMEHGFPFCRFSIGTKGLVAFFKYIKEDKVFYLALANYENGQLLKDALVYVYDKATERVSEYAKPVVNKEKRINPDIYKIYTHSALATVIVFWLHNNMKIPVEDIARDTGLMMEHAHSFVRDRYLL